MIKVLIKVRDTEDFLPEDDIEYEDSVDVLDERDKSDNSDSNMKFVDVDVCNSSAPHFYESV
jgi:hypothetical protein